jgi:fumarate hydratase, class II
MTEFRVESDSMGEILVPADKYWGCQTQRSKQNFPIGDEREHMPPQLIKAFGILKKAAALVNLNFGLPKNVSEAIVQAADEVRKGYYDCITIVHESLISYPSR